MDFRFDTFVLDAGRRRLQRSGRDVHLSPKAFDLLHLLVAKRPDAVSKTAIQDALWPSTHVVEANVANLVAEIRSALGDRGGRFIRTVPRFGYAFVGDRDAAAAGDAEAFTLARGAADYALRNGATVLGQSKEFGGLFDSPTISRRHARIVVGGASATIEDLGSKNGTFVNGARVTGSVTLQDGDTVRLGSATVTFCARGSERPTQSLSEE